MRKPPPTASTPASLRAVLEKPFFLDDADRKLIAMRRGEDNRLELALQVTTARFVGRFPPDPLDLPDEVVDYPLRLSWGSLMRRS